MKFPRVVEICGHSVSVKMRERFVADKHNVYGRSRLCQDEIIIARRDKYRNKISNDWKGNTFLHEIMHHINDKLEVGLSEKEVGRISDGLYQTLKDNKIRF